MEKDLILKYIQRDATEKARRERLFDYYNGEHDILSRVMEDKSKPNNRVANGYPYLISNSYTGYMFGRPVSYSAEEEAFDLRLQACYKYNDEQDVNTAIGLDMSICGVGVEVLYTDADGMERFCGVSPIGCIDVRDGTIENNLEALIRYYDVFDIKNNRTQTHVEVLDAQYREHYIKEGSELALIEQSPHGFGDVPVVIWENNKFRMGDFEPVITQIDAYNVMQSDAINDQEYFTDAMLALYGIGDMGNEEDGGGVAGMKQRRVLLLPSDSKAEWLIKSQNDQTPENIKDRLNNDIHKFSGCPDMTDENFAGNASGVALRYKLLDFEINASAKQRGIKKALQRRLELLCNIWSVKGQGTWDWRDVQISFKRALPENLLEISQTLSNFGKLLSDETKRSMIPMDLDEDVEKRRLEDESQQGMSLFTIDERQSLDVIEGEGAV